MEWVRITGLGAHTALGRGAEALWQGALDGRVAIAAPTALSLPELPSARVGEALGRTAPQTDRALILAQGALEEATANAGWTAAQIAAPDTALVVATAKAGIGLAQRVLEGELAPGALHHFPLHELAGRLARSLGVRGPVLTVSVACASGTTAVGHAHRLLRQGRARRAMVVGADGLSEFVVRGFATLRALASDAARPFDAERSGLAVGEAGAALILETGPGRARARMGGYGGSNDANHVTGPARDGRGLVRAVTAALAMAQLEPTAVDAISAHGTATRFNDAMEGVAFSTLFGERTVPVHSIKGAIGHSLGAAGLVEAVLCVRGLEAGAWPPVAGLRTLDPDIPLDVVQGAPREGDLRVVVSTSSGFSGINSAVVLCRA